jgi:surfeit locus 1 family protein
MSRSIPIIPTMIVTLACATMVGLGIWQLRRADWKEGLLAQYRTAQNLPPIAYPAIPSADTPLFRRSSVMCLTPMNWRAVAGRNRKGVSGWSHIAKCRTGVEGPGAVVDVGWKTSPAFPKWGGGEVSGVIVPDRDAIVRLVNDKAVPGEVEPSAAMTPDDIPNNHLVYAIQWFLFAGIAALIYGLALRRRKVA